jgi:hypothetical protein
MHNANHRSQRVCHIENCFHLERDYYTPDYWHVKAKQTGQKLISCPGSFQNRQILMVTA